MISSRNDSIDTGLELAWLTRGALYVAEQAEFTTDEARAAGDLVHKFYKELDRWERDNFRAQLEDWTRAGKITRSHKEQVLRNAGVRSDVPPWELDGYYGSDGIDNGLELAWLVRGAMYVSEFGGVFTDGEARATADLIDKFAAKMSAYEVYNYRDQVNEWADQGRLTRRNLDEVMAYSRY